MNWTIVIIATAILLAIAVVLGLLLAFGGKYLSVKVDERVTDVTAMLPGFNCGGCGSAGCAQFAQSLVDGEKTVDNCKPSKPENKAKITEYLNAHKS